MSSPSTLKELYVDEMQDLWSANDQMSKAVEQLAGQASDSKLKTMLEGMAGGIGKHTNILKELIEAAGGKAKPEHCKGMEGLVVEALKHGVKEAAKDGDLHDIQILSQLQRMSHYGIAGFGTATAYAKALSLKDDEKKLKSAVSDIYKSDEQASSLAERLEKLAA